MYFILLTINTKKFKTYWICFPLSCLNNRTLQGHVNIKKEQTGLKKGHIISIVNSNMTYFFCFVNKRASYPFDIISLAHAPVKVTDFSIGSIIVTRVMPIEGAVLFELHKLCAIFSASVNINYRLPIKYITVFVLLDISESKEIMEARMCF